MKYILKKAMVSFYVGKSLLLFFSGFLKHLCYLSCVFGGVLSTSTVCL